MRETGSPADGQAGRGGVRQRLGHLAGSFSNRVLEEVDADVVLQSVDLDALLARIDLDALVARLDLDAAVDRVDVNRILDGVDVNRLLDRVEVNRLLDRVEVDTLVSRADVNALLERADVDALLRRADLDALLRQVDVDALVHRVDVEALMDRIDVERLLARVDLEALVRRAGIPELVADSTSQVASSALDLGRRQLVGLDVGLGRIIPRLLGRDPNALPAGPPALVDADHQQIHAPDPDQSRRTARFEVSGFYAGPVSRLAALALDVFFATSAFTAGAVALSWMLANLVGIELDAGERGGLLWTLAFSGWLFSYWWLSAALAGRTPAMLLVGCRIVARDGSPLTPGRALVRTVTLPISLLAFGAGGAWMLVDRERRAFHDLLAGSAVVYDWGGRPAQMPTPLARWLEAHST